ncbi:Uncharacterised protein [Mycobacteroides abscessus subsp. abscessus]|nr:Uncharacterised protein [Mycobacteroides abscessus subsp. abscessus]
MGSPEKPVSLRKSFVPKARRKVPGASAIFVAFSTPRADSRRAMTGRPAFARIAV